MSYTIRPEALPHVGRPPVRRWPNGFADRLTAPLASFLEVVTVVQHGGFRTDIGDVDLIPVYRSKLPRPTGTEALITWVGHATFVLQLGGLTVLTDPVWARKIPGIRPRLTPPGVAWSDLPPIDAVVISHNHYDHLDAPTIRRLPKDTAIFVPANLARWFTRRGFRNVAELDWWESASLGDVTFSFVPAHHWSRRALWDTCKTLWGGWILTSRHHRVYFAGDSGYGHRFKEIGIRYPDIDVALMPVGAYSPRWFMKNFHVDPDQAVQAFLDVGARHMATMHWGTFVLSGEPLLAPLEETRQSWTIHNLDPTTLWDLSIGETRTLPT
ncbi:membrane protein [Acrocarpospora phusangensis]|uniref:Membrane protein n=1 Tax=Acrocarpospora phusangensis TaxID=1070424 RepID=A0A919UNF9_9ACTN|nr:MBL fold metallo-hydrolase [Acrocarpospora phusangensis]GIH27874.1 membrane protein [Acrocarpospora phusangensis]